MVNISVFGRGNMGKAVGGVFADAGHEVVHFGHDSQVPDDLGQIVILATQYKDMAAVIDAHKEKLKGKIVIDISNPVNFETMDEMLIPAGTSAAEIFADKLPESTVVKAFNTNFFANLTSKKIADQITTTVQIAGDDEKAKATVSQYIKDAGLGVADVGALKRSRELEAMGYLQILLAVREEVTFQGGYAILK
ncbi:NADPH-dependent F420 reductase [Streptococcus macacae]|uniref:NADP oxidoreductase coenzyme F420-dependent n=1 Tax=Streptococcus macacae NCTC 11558 TaxID=764298 RepID=G5JZ32_9STRE|nr:hypothetical protein [Streptococcus macacae]EHJ52794.1 hypothetical protein STRMA_0449 [Streptococcus macacae NCTC 11558]SUN78286.1 NADPH-dependent F420 reductase [Streptococcus macacae NCTC 11558]